MGRVVRWLLGLVVTVVVLGVIAVVVFVVLTRNPDIDEFYDPPDVTGLEPGTVLRSEPFDAGLPAGSEGWRVLYVSTDSGGAPIAVSGLVVAPADPPDGPRPVLAWAHGTTGIARACAPSLTDEPLLGIPDLSAAVAAGWVITLTDYPGLGTPSPHPYLIGESEGRAVLDSVRSAGALDLGGIELDDRYAIWGHSQGGHAALFAGQLAPTYLPDRELVGVAALSPATDLQANLAAVRGTAVGNVLTLMTVESWIDIYADVPDATLTDDARGPAERMVRNCVNQPSRFRLLLGQIALPDDVIAIDPVSDPTWVAHLDANTPAPGGITGPLFVAQGLADDIVDPAVTEAWLAARCAAGLPIESRTYPEVDHPSIVGPGGIDAYAWTVDRFAGAVLEPKTCVAR